MPSVQQFLIITEVVSAHGGGSPLQYDTDPVILSQGLAWAHL